MANPIRTIKLSQDTTERLRADLESCDSEQIAELVAVLMRKAALGRVRAWEEIHRVANTKPEIERVRLSLFTNEILVFERRVGDADEY
jgi:hypothetical protein